MKQSTPNPILPPAYSLTPDVDTVLRSAAHLSGTGAVLRSEKIARGALSCSRDYGKPPTLCVAADAYLSLDVPPVSRRARPESSKALCDSLVVGIGCAEDDVKGGMLVCHT